MKYYRSCVKLLKYMKKNRVIGFGKYAKACVVRFCGYVLLPNKMRVWAYKKFLRNRSEVTDVQVKELVHQ